MNIHPAKPGDYDAVRRFYHKVIDQMDAADYHIFWEKGYYPSDQSLRDAVEAGALYFGSANDEIAAAMVLNQSCAEGYRHGCWRSRAGESLVLHLLAVEFSRHGKGIGREMVEYAKIIAAQQGMKALRLDVIDGNEPAKKLYLKCGFQSCGSFRTVIDGLGELGFALYECII